MQFFSSLNYQLLPLILNKARFNCKILTFFSNYLFNKKTKYLWNSFSSPLCNVEIGVGQGLALSPILSALYLSLIFHILEKCLKILKIPISILSFVNNGLFISQNKFFSVSNTNLFCSYNIISTLLIKFGLVIEHRKTEVFHFSRKYGVFNPPPLDLTPLGGSVLFPKTIWRYLGFVFNQKLSFWSYIDFYVNKAISTIKCMKMLGNLSRGLISLQKRWLYRYCALPIVLYGFQLWYYNKAPLDYSFKVLRKMQLRAALWISDASCTMPTAGIEVIPSLIPIHLHLKKLYGRSYLKGFLLPSNHIIKSIISTDRPNDHTIHCLSLNSLMPKQISCLNSLLIDMDNRYNKFLPSFFPFNREFSSGILFQIAFPSILKHMMSRIIYTNLMTLLSRPLLTSHLMSLFLTQA